MALPQRDHCRQSAWVSEALTEERWMRRCDGNGLVILGRMKWPVRTSELHLPAYIQDSVRERNPGKPSTGADAGFECQESCRGLGCHGPGGWMLGGCPKWSASLQGSPTLLLASAVFGVP